MLLNILLIRIVAVSAFVTVIDIPEDDPSNRSDGIYARNYCDMKGCRVISHYLCSHNPNVLSKFKLNRLPIDDYIPYITKKFKRKILMLVNGIRSKIALGLETGMNNKQFPRGYGFNKIEWDQELADITDLKLKQCEMKTAACVATEKFPNPQLLSSQCIRTTSADSENITNEQSLMTNVLKDEIFDKWYITLKNEISNPVVVPEYEDIANIAYHGLVNAKATHIGCGVMLSLRARGLKSRRFECYMSHSLNKGDETYYTTIPQGHSPQCGCPPGSTEEEKTCLCIQGSSGITDVEPNIILLPIVDVENAVPTTMLEHLKTSREDAENKRSMKQLYDNTSLDLYNMKTLSLNDQDKEDSISLLEMENDSSEMNKRTKMREDAEIEDIFNNNSNDEEQFVPDDEKLEHIEKELSAEVLKHLRDEYLR